MAYELGKIAMHSRIFVRLTDRTQVVPDDKSGRVPIEEVAWKHLEEQRKRRNADYAGKPQSRRSSTSHVILTTVGRCIFNDILPKAMPFYNYALTAKGSQPRDRRQLRQPRPAGDDRAARRHEGARLQAQRRSPGCRFGITDIRSPDSKQTILDEGQKKADKIEKNYRMGAITDQERYTQLIDVWGHARKQVTEDLMAGLQNDYRDDDGRPFRPTTPRTCSSTSTRSP